MSGPQGPRTIEAKDETASLRAVVNKQILNNFRKAILIRHGEYYGHVQLEVNRALADRTAVMIAEAQTMDPVAQSPLGEKKDKDPLLANVFAGEGGDVESSEEGRAY